MSHDARTPPPRRVAGESPKEGESADPVLPQPVGPEVESARLLANQARDQLRAHGLADADIDRLADAYIAEDLGEAIDDFIAWALGEGRDVLRRA